MRFVCCLMLLIAGIGAAAWEAQWLRRSDASDHSSRLEQVIANGNAEELHKLVSSGIDLDVRDGDGTTPLICAALFGRERDAAMLIDAGATLDVTDSHGWTPCMMAAAGGYGDVLQRLIQAGANVNVQSADGRTALNFAADDGHPELVAMLLKSGARPNPARPLPRDFNLNPGERPSALAASRSFPSATLHHRHRLSHAPRPAPEG